MKLLIIYNNNAAHSRASKQIGLLKSELKKNNLDYEIILSKDANEAYNAVKHAEFNDYDAIVPAGGDGTLYTTLNAYMENTSEKRIPFGALPLGTGNAFVKDIGLEVNQIEKAVKIIKSGKLKKVDIGKFNTNGKDYYFINIIGMGFVTDVGTTAKKLKFFGNSAYTLGVLYQTTFLKTFDVEIEYDGKKFNDSSIFIEVSNSRYTGRTFLMAPEAEIDDGLFDVVIMKKASRMKLLSGLPKIFTGKHIFMDEVESFQAKSISIKTSSPKILTPDGELMGSTPITIENLHGAVEFFVE